MVFYNAQKELYAQKLTYSRLKHLWESGKEGKERERFVRQLLASAKSLLGGGRKKSTESWKVWMEIFTCKCGWLLHSPCTLPCGHTICKLCFDSAEFCTICGATSDKKFIINTTLSGWLERWFPDHYHSAEQRYSARVMIDDRRYVEAIDTLNKVLEVTKDDFIALNLRSEANLKLHRLRQCFKDAKRSCKINENCGESFLRLGEAYAALNRLDDAVEAFNTCLELEPEDGKLNVKVCDTLDQLIAMSPRSEIELSDSEGEENGESTNASLTTSLNFALHDSEKLESPTDGKEKQLCNLGHQQVNTLEIQTCSEEDNSPCKITDDSGTKINTIQSESVCGENSSLGEISSGQNSDIMKSGDCVCQPSGSSHSHSGQTVSDESYVIATSVITNVSSTPSTSVKRSRSVSNDSSQCREQCEKKAKTSTEVIPQFDDFECKLCFFILFQPVTTPCGHVFCKICLERCIDHNPSCPICRGALAFQENGVGCVTEVIDQLIKHYYENEYSARQKKHNEYMKSLARVGEDESVEVPIFTCTLALPTLQCPLHVFEPRYRMMLRECLQSGSNKFGICLADKEKEGGHIDYGTIVEVKHVKFLPDGRSIIDTVGGRRFRTVDRRSNNGISLTKVEYFQDETDALQSDVAMEMLINKSRAVYENLSTYVGNLHPTERECITNALGPVPQPSPNPLESPNGESWVWWATAALPMNDKAKLMMFKSRSLLDRVTIIQRFLSFLSRMSHKPQASVS